MTRLLSLIAILAASLPLLADDAKTYTLKIRAVPETGKSVKETSTTKSIESSKVLDGDGKLVKEEKKEKTSTSVFTEKIIEGGDKKPKKYSRSYSRAEETVDGKTTKRPVHGRTVVFTRENKKYKVEVEGKPALDEKAIEELEKDANKNVDEDSFVDALMPKKAVKVGETWKLESKEVAKMIAEIGGDKTKAKAQGKLVKAFEKDGKQYGVLEFTIDTPVKGNASGKAELAFTVETPIDGSSTAGKLSARVKFEVDQTVEQNGMKFKVEVRVRNEEAGERVDVVEKK